MRTTKTVKLTLEDPAKKATVFKAKRIVKPLETAQSQIDKAVLEMKNADKEQELLKRELEKPMKQRNKALMDKYNILDGSKLTDNYPDLAKGVSYDLDVYFPEDDGVKIEERPKPWYVGLTIEWEGNKFNYRFPIHNSTYHDGQSLYKLDGFSVYVDRDGVIKNDISDYTIFQALTDFHAGTLRNGMVNDLFYQYKVIKEDVVDEDILNPDVPKDFAIKGHNVFVNSKVIKGATTTAKANTVTSGQQLTHPFKYSSSMTIPTADVMKWTAEKTSLADGIVIPGLTKKLPAKVLVLDEFKAVKTSTATTPRYVILTSRPGSPDKLYISLSIGPSVGLASAQAIDPSVTKSSLVRWIQDHNKKQYDEWSAGIEGKKKKAEDDAAEAEFQRLKTAKEEAKKKAEEEAIAKAKKDVEDEAAKKAADKLAKEEAKKKAEEDKAKAEKEMAKLIQDALGGAQQPHAEMLEKPSVIIVDKETTSAVNKKKVQNGIVKLYDLLADNDLVIDGVRSKIKSAYSITIERFYGHTDDAFEEYISVIEPEGSGIAAYIFGGFESVRRYFGLKDRDSDLDIAKHVVKHNQQVFKKVTRAK